MAALVLWRLVHFFGFICWFVGLLGTTAAQVGVRKAGDVPARRAAWAVLKRLQPYEIIGLVLTPIGGILLTTTIYGSLFKGTPAFVHIKLVLVIVAFVLNLVILGMRARAEPLLQTDGPVLAGKLKRINMLQGIATLMLPAAVIVVIAMKYGS